MHRWRRGRKLRQIARIRSGLIRRQYMETRRLSAATLGGRSRQAFAATIGHTP